MAGADEARKILVVNKKPITLLSVAARHMFGFISIGLFTSIGINVVKHGCSKVAREIIWVLYMVANAMVINVLEFVSLSNSFYTAPVEGITVVCCRSLQQALLLFHAAHSLWARLSSSPSSPSYYRPNTQKTTSPLLSPELQNQIQTHVAYSLLEKSTPMSQTFTPCPPLFPSPFPHPPRC